MARRRTWWSNAALRSALIEGVGVSPFTILGSSLVPRFFLLLETGDFLLLESGDKIILEG